MRSLAQTQVTGLLYRDRKAVPTTELDFSRGPLIACPPCDLQTAVNAAPLDRRTADKTRARAVEDNLPPEEDSRADDPLAQLCHCADEEYTPQPFLPPTRPSRRAALSHRALVPDDREHNFRCRLRACHFHARIHVDGNRSRSRVKSISSFCWARTRRFHKSSSSRTYIRR